MDEQLKTSLSEISLPKLDFINEKGNVKVGTRKILRSQMLARLNSVYNDWVLDKVPNASGGFSLCLGVDARTGSKVWAHVGLTINDKDPSVDPYTGKARIKNEIEIPKLFDD